jgi:hypothetical protein
MFHGMNEFCIRAMNFETILLLYSSIRSVMWNLSRILSASQVICFVSDFQESANSQ